MEAAKWAPSGVNHQPTQVAVLGKETKNKLAKIHVEKHSAGITPNPGYVFCPKEWAEVYIKRRKACGLALYQSLSISSDNKEAKKVNWERNYHFFHAPVGLIIFIEKKYAKGILD
ncbi:Nitroreductase family protein [Candidatus Rubidus massiliensis]|nr:Nitroreductase family protein [Candidatus Rubidus massiliensis]